MSRHWGLALLVVMGSAACNPVGCCAPAALPKDTPLIMHATGDHRPSANVDVLVDGFDIPHLFGQTENDLAYGLGVMHARERLFQITVFKYAGEGRLTEILGKDLLETDRANRMITVGLDAQLAAFKPRDRAILDAYVDGFNAGAAQVGPSAEMKVLGVDVEPFTARDSLAITRLQQWDQSVGFTDELARLRMVQKLGVNDPRLHELVQDPPSGGVPIVSVQLPDAHHARARVLSPMTSSRTALPTRVTPRAPDDSLKAKLLFDVLDELKHAFAHGGSGASNSWAVSGAHTDNGAPVVVNDPHLGHSAPGIFYMVHMEGPDFTIAGGTFPGIPAVLIGHGRHIAWGVTNAFADTQDLVVLRDFEGRKDMYQLDGAPMNYGQLPQSYKFGSGKNAEVFTETWQTSVFGPVFPPNYNPDDNGVPQIGSDERIALMWTGIAFPDDNSALLSAFWDLARASNIDEATAATENFTTPSMNVAIALDDGTIAYRLSGIVPRRGDDERVDFPRNGATRSAGWVGRLRADEKPALTNPPEGFLVASNQRILENGTLSQAAVGFEAAEPWRALGAHNRISDLISAGKVSAQQLLDIQQDSTSLEWLAWIPILGAHCPAHVDGHDDAQVKSFCDDVRTFDGNATTDSVKALAFARLYASFQREVVRTALGDDLVGPALSETFITMSLLSLAQLEEAGTHTATFDDPSTSTREGIAGFEARAAKDALDKLVVDTGGSPSDWRWGRVHTRELKGLLASAPVIGFLFTAGSHEESGSDNAVRAEHGNPDQAFTDTFGSGMRLVGDMTSSPTVRMINDIGNSGHFGTAHVNDLYDLWSVGKPFQMALSRSDVEKILEGQLRIEPQ
jgi:penicillin amidase